MFELSISYFCLSGFGALPARCVGASEASVLGAVIPVLRATPLWIHGVSDGIGNATSAKKSPKNVKKRKLP
eukprot:3651824-Amphidinium_carterae.1